MAQTSMFMAVSVIPNMRHSKEFHAAFVGEIISDDKLEPARSWFACNLYKHDLRHLAQRTLPR